VFISSKFKDAHGHFVDLTKYVKTDENTGRLIIDEERFPLEYLRLMGFRIPNQGHNSMAQIEIAGFLPAECGDLVIASQDFTVQMGSDKR
jgi:hypothetical protein